MKKYVYIKAINKDSKKIINNFFGTNNSEIEYIKSLKNLNLKGIIFIDELSSLGNTMYQIIGNIMEIINKEITIHIIKEKLSFQGKNKSLSFSELQDDDHHISSVKADSDDPWPRCTESGHWFRFPENSPASPVLPRSSLLPESPS